MGGLLEICEPSKFAYKLPCIYTFFLGKRGGKVCIGLSEGVCNSLNSPNPYCRGLRIVNNSSHGPHSETPSALSSFFLFLITCKEFRCRQFQHHGEGAEVSSGGRQGTERSLMFPAHPRQLRSQILEWWPRKSPAGKHVS